MVAAVDQGNMLLRVAQVGVVMLAGWGGGPAAVGEGGRHRGPSGSSDKRGHPSPALLCLPPNPISFVTPSPSHPHPCCLPQSAVQTMRDFQAAQRRHISDGLPLEQLCAVINNNVRCYDESLEFAEGLEERFAEQAKGACGGCSRVMQDGCLGGGGAKKRSGWERWGRLSGRSCFTDVASFKNAASFRATCIRIPHSHRHPPTHPPVRRAEH